MKHVNDAGIQFKDLHTKQSSLEDIFVSLVEGGRAMTAASTGTPCARSTASRWRAPGAR